MDEQTPEPGAPEAINANQEEEAHTPSISPQQIEYPEIQLERSVSAHADPDQHKMQGQQQLLHEQIVQVVQQGFQGIDREIQGLRADFATKIKYDSSKEKIIDTLHKELQSYREGLHFKILRPLVVDLIAMHDDLGKLSEGLTEQVQENLLSFQESIVEMLARNGIETFTLAEPVFVASKQRIVKVIETTQPELDKCIATRVRTGFLYYEKILRPELVNVYKYVPTIGNDAKIAPTLDTMEAQKDR